MTARVERPDLDGMDRSLDVVDEAGWSDHAPNDYLADSLRDVIAYALQLEQDAAAASQKTERLASYILHWPACVFRADQYQPCNCGLEDALRYRQ